MKLIFNSVEEVVSFVERMGIFKPFTDKFRDPINSNGQSPENEEEPRKDPWYLPRGYPVIVRHYAFDDKCFYRLYYPMPMVVDPHQELGMDVYFTDIPDEAIGHIIPGEYKLKDDLWRSTLVNQDKPLFPAILGNILGDVKPGTECGITLYPRFDRADGCELVTAVTSVYGGTCVGAEEMPVDAIYFLNWYLTRHVQCGANNLNRFFDIARYSEEPDNVKGDVLCLPEFFHNWQQKHKIYGPYVRENRNEDFNNQAPQITLEFRYNKKIDEDFLETEDTIHEHTPPITVPNCVRNEGWLNSWRTVKGDYKSYVDWSYTQDSRFFTNSQFFTFMCALDFFFETPSMRANKFTDIRLSWIAHQIFNCDKNIINRPKKHMWVHVEQLDDSDRFEFTDSPNGAYIVHLRNVMSETEWNWLIHDHAEVIGHDIIPIYRSFIDQTDGTWRTSNLKSVLDRNMNRDPECVIYAKILATIASRIHIPSLVREDVYDDSYDKVGFEVPIMFDGPVKRTVRVNDKFVDENGNEHVIKNYYVTEEEHEETSSK